MMLYMMKGVMLIIQCHESMGSYLGDLVSDGANIIGNGDYKMARRGGDYIRRKCISKLNVVN